MSQSIETRWAPVQAALERASKKQRANPIGEKLDKIEEMLRAWLAADSDEVGDEARAASLAALHARIEAENGGSVKRARLLAARAIESLRRSHGGEHALTLEVSRWAEDVKVRAELESDLSAQAIFRDPDDCETRRGNARGMEEPPRGAEPLRAF